jgi:chromate transporter
VKRPSLLDFILYFLRLGALGFGGPAALTNAMRRDLVETRDWLTAAEFENGLALAAACPGPLAYQLGIYCGYVRFGAGGGIAVAIAFGLPPFIIVTAAAYLYVRFAGDWHVRALFYGIAPAIVALIIKACWNLGRRTLRGDRMAWLFAVTACAITVIVQRELALMFIAAGLLGALVFAPARATTRPTTLNAVLIVPGMSAKLFLFFLKTGLLVFGSGLVIVPFLKTQLVDQYHWLGNRQFLDAVAIGMISPGPVVITATFVGYLLDGISGAVAATTGIFLPPLLFTIVATPILLRYYKNPRLAGFIRGVGVTVVGVLVGTSYLVAQQAIGDWQTAAIAACSLLVVTIWPKVPEPLMIGAAGLAGLLAYRLMH